MRDSRNMTRPFIGHPIVIGARAGALVAVLTMVLLVALGSVVAGGPIDRPPGTVVSHVIDAVAVGAAVGASGVAICLHVRSNAADDGPHRVPDLRQPSLCAQATPGPSSEWRFTTTVGNNERHTVHGDVCDDRGGEIDGQGKPEEAGQVAAREARGEAGQARGTLGSRAEAVGART